MERLMSWRMRIEHRTTMHYSGTVHASYNEVRITPRNVDRQFAISHHIDVDPGTSLYTYVDAWHTIVNAFDVQEAHRTLVVTGTSIVESSDSPSGGGVELGWNDLASDRTRDDFCEFLWHSSRVSADAEIADTAAELRQSRTPAEAIAATCEWINSSFEYQTGSTTVSTTASEVLHARRGVCQDFAHLGIALLRSMGIPARYVSGYLHPDPDAERGRRYAGESHAWLEAWAGGWHSLDPTIGAPVGERHVLVGRGRDYADVAPLKGIYHGAAAESVDVEVELERLT
jgi:transglutaminase-like putative cysteine protease